MRPGSPARSVWTGDPRRETSPIRSWLAPEPLCPSAFERGDVASGSRCGPASQSVSSVGGATSRMRWARDARTRIRRSWPVSRVMLSIASDVRSRGHRCLPERGDIGEHSFDGRHRGDGRLWYRHPPSIPTLTSYPSSSSSRPASASASIGSRTQDRRTCAALISLTRCCPYQFRGGTGSVRDEARELV